MYLIFYQKIKTNNIKPYGKVKAKIELKYTCWHCEIKTIYYILINDF